MLNITEQIADHLAQIIITGQMSGGARIQELKVASELGVSRGSVREALLMLERRYLIDIVPRKGALVNDITAAEALEMIELLCALEHRWFSRLIREPDLRECWQDAAESLCAMEQAGRMHQVPEMILARGEFYAVLLSGATRYIRGVFDCLLPSSQRMLHGFIVNEKIDLHDIARYYKAVFSSLEKGDEGRLAELLNAFHKRMGHLTRASLSVAAGKVDRAGSTRISNALASSR